VVVSREDGRHNYLGTLGAIKPDGNIRSGDELFNHMLWCIGDWLYRVVRASIKADMPVIKVSPIQPRSMGRLNFVPLISNLLRRSVLWRLRWQVSRCEIQQYEGYIRCLGARRWSGWVLTHSWTWHPMSLIGLIPWRLYFELTLRVIFVFIIMIAVLRRYCFVEKAPNKMVVRLTDIIEKDLALRRS